MNKEIITHLLSFYGVFLIACGIASVIFIGKKAKTAIVSGGTAGIISLLIAFLISIEMHWARVAGLIISLALFTVFSWRSTLTLFKVFELIHTNHSDLKGKGIAFLIISLMAIVSIIVFILQLILFF